LGKDKKFLDLFLEKWATIKEPIRPSKEENRFYEYYIEEISKRDEPQMLILGATPDFRDMAIKRGITPVSADLVPEIFDAMKDWMEEEGEEEFLQCDWLEIPENRKYDLIIADGALNMLSRNALFPYFEKMSRILKDNGLFVQRILITNENLDLKAYERAIKEYREKKYDMNIFLYTLYFKNCLQEIMFPDLTPTEIYEQWLFPYHTDEEKAVIREYLFFSRIYFPFQKELDEAIEKFFNVVRLRRYDDIGFWDTGAQYVLKKKSDSECQKNRIS
jgi:hypothetical protein